MYERWTDRARYVLKTAETEARKIGHEYIGTEHVLLGLVKEGGGVAAGVLKKLSIDPHRIQREVDKIVQAGPFGEQVIFGRLPLTPRSKKAIEFAIEEARALKHNYVGTEHLLLGLLREEEGVAGHILIMLGLTLEVVCTEIRALLGKDTSPGLTQDMARIEIRILLGNDPSGELANSDRSRTLLQVANHEAVRSNADYIGTEHVLLGLVSEDSGVASLLRNLRIDPCRIRDAVKSIWDAREVEPDALPCTPRVIKAIRHANEEARNLNHSHLRAEHVLLGLLREKESTAAQALMNLGLTLEAVRTEVVGLLNKPEAPPERAEDWDFYVI
jgi:ATP-dependent Clp protease ATP-binding subunit ClpA